MASSDSLREIANAALGVCAPSFTLLDQAVEAHLSRVDDISAQLDAAREEVSTTVEAGYPALLQNTRELISLFVAIEKSEEAVERVSIASKAAQERLEALQKGYDSKYPEGISLLKSWLGARSRSAIDAPVTLPAWNPASATIHAEHEVAVLTSALNLASQSRAALARRTVEEAGGVGALTSSSSLPASAGEQASASPDGETPAATAAEADAAVASDASDNAAPDAAAAAGSALEAEAGGEQT